MEEIEIKKVEKFIKNVKNLSDEEQFTIFGSSERTIRKPIENLLEAYKKDISELETYKKIAEKLAIKLTNVAYYNYTIDDLIDWARKEVENDVE